MSADGRVEAMEKAMEAAEPLLTYERVTVCYGGRPAAREVSFSLRPGEILCAAGESGSGKSTLLRAAVGLLEEGGAVTSGRIRFQGRELTALPERELRRVRGAGIGLLFQDAGASLCPVRRVGRQIYEGMRAHGRLTLKEARERALWLFEKLRLQEGPRVWDSFPCELSGGQRQRVALAAAMLAGPKVLLCDEPTSALDPFAQRQVMGELLRVRELFGTAILLVTHNLSLASAMADTLLVLREGTVREYGEAGRVLRAPEDPYTKALLSAAPRLRRM